MGMYGGFINPEDLIRILKGSSGMDRENDPSKYPRSVEITDPYVLGWLAERNAKIDEARELSDKLQIAIAELDLLKKKTFRKLKELHPNIEISDNTTTGFRLWEGKYYYVGWEDK